MDAALFAATAGLGAAWAVVRMSTFEERRPLRASERRKLRKANIQAQRADLRRQKARARRARLSDLTKRAESEGIDSLSAEDKDRLEAAAGRKARARRKAEAGELRRAAAASDLHVVVNCAYDCNSARERQSLSHQLMRVYAANKRHASAGAAGHVLVWRPPADVHERLRKIDVDQWVAFGVEARPGGAEGATAARSESAEEDARAGAASLAECPLVTEGRDRVVVLTPDSDHVLETVEPDAIVVIGGIVDRTIRKGQTMRTAEELGVAHARLPVRRSLEEAGEASLTRTVVLNVDTVAEAVFRRRAGHEWTDIMKDLISARVVKRNQVKPAGKKSKGGKGVE